MKFNREIIENSDEPEWIKELRLRAFDRYKKFQNAGSIFSNHAMKIEPKENDFSPAKKIPKEFAFAGEKSNICICDSKTAELSVKKLFAKEIKEAFISFPEICRHEMNANSREAMPNFNTAFFNSGIFLLVPDDAEAEIDISSILTDSNRLSISHNLILLGKNSKLILSDSNYSQMTEGAFSSVFTRIHLNEGAELLYKNLHAFGKNILARNMECTLEKNSRIASSTSILGSSQALSGTQINLNGVGSSANILDVAFGRQSEEYDICTNVVQCAPETKAAILQRGAFAGSHGILKGFAEIEKDATNSELFFSSHSILLDREAVSSAIPVLRVNNNSSAAKHSASVSRIDESRIFYLMSRGMSEKEAKKMITAGFLMPLNKADEKQRILFNSKWDGLDTVNTLACLDGAEV